MGDYPREGCCDRREIKPFKKRCRVWYLERLMSGASRSPRRAARRQLFQAEDVYLEGGGWEKSWHPTCQLFCVCASVSVNSLPFDVPPRSAHLHFLLGFISWYEEKWDSSSGGSNQVLFCFLNLMKYFYNPPGFFSFTAAPFNYKPILGPEPFASMRILSR